MPLFRRKPKPAARVYPLPRTRALAVAPTSVDIEKRTFSFVLSTENVVRVCSLLPSSDEPQEFDEVLSADGLDQSRLTGAPLVDSHDLSTVDRIVGVVETISREGNVWTGTGRLSKNDKGSRVLTDISDGILRQVSVGYTVQTYSVQTREGQVPLATATAWTPHEVSIVAVGADPAALIRAANLSSQDPNQETNMDPEVLSALQAAADKIVAAAEAAQTATDALSAAGASVADVTAAQDATDQATDAADAANSAVSDLGGDDAADSNGERDKRMDTLKGAKAARAKARAEGDASGDQSNPEKKPDPAANADEVAARAMAKKAGLSSLADKLFTSGATVSEVRSALLQGLVARSEAVGEIVTRPATNGNPETPKRSIAADVYSRMNKRSA